MSEFVIILLMCLSFASLDIQQGIHQPSPHVVFLWSWCFSNDTSAEVKQMYANLYKFADGVTLHQHQCVYHNSEQTTSSYHTHVILYKLNSPSFILLHYVNVAAA